MQPSKDAPEVTQSRSFTHEGLDVEELAFDTSSGSPITAYFLPPARAAAGAILYCHAHGNRYDIGKSELLFGRPALQKPYLPDLAERGWAILCVEMPTFGARQTPNESALSKSHLWGGTTLFGQMLCELVLGLNFLSAHPQIDADKIATLGVSMGGTHAWWLHALDTRVRAAVSICCFADMQTLIETGAHDGHGHYMTVPGLLPLVSTGQIAGLAYPRPQLHCVGLKDWSTPEPAFDIARKDLSHAYRHEPDMLSFYVSPDTEHAETAEMRTKTLGFLTRYLAG